MTVGIAERLGIAYDDCKAVNPDVVYCNTYAYGAEGPLAHFGGLDPLFQATAGLEYEEGPVHAGKPPLYYRFGMCDTANAMLSVVGSLAALYHQRRTGEGQELWTSLLDGGAVLSSNVFVVDGEAVAGRAARRRRPRDRRVLPPLRDRRRVAPDRGGEARALGRALRCARAARSSPTTRAFAIAGSPASSVGPSSRRCSSPRSRRHTALVWSRLLDQAGVPNEVPVDTKAGELVLFDADNERLGLVAEYEHPILGRMRQYGTFIDFSETPGRIRGPVPMVGEHTREILAWLGYDEAAMDEFRDQGVVNWPDESYRWTI